MNELLLLWLAALVLMGSPGPATVSLAGVGAAFGVRNGVPYLGGVMLGTFGVLVMIATGVTGLILAVPGAAVVLTVIAVAYILYLAWKIASAPALAGSSGGAVAPAFASGFALAIANPKAFAAIGAAFVSHTLVSGTHLGDALAKVAALSVMIVVVNTAWLGFGASFATLLRTPRVARIANLTFAVLLVASVGMALLGL